MDDILTIPGLQQFLVHVAVAIVILAFGWLLSNYTGRLVKRMAVSSVRIDPTIVPMIYSVVVWGIRVLVLIVALAQLGIQTTSVIAVLGAAGLAVGLALQGTLQNIAAGIMLLILRPLRAGESVKVVGKAEGRVDEVGLFLSRFQQYDGTYISLPNSLVWGNPIINYSRNATRRIEFSVRLLYRYDAESLLTAIEDILAANGLILKEPAADVSVVDQGDYAAGIRVRAWVRAADYTSVLKQLQHDVWLQVHESFKPIHQ